MEEAKAALKRIKFYKAIMTLKGADALVVLTEERIPSPDFARIRVQIDILWRHLYPSDERKRVCLLGRGEVDCHCETGALDATIGRKKLARARHALQGGRDLHLQHC